MTSFASLPSVPTFMHPLFEKADALGRIAIGAAIEVHRLKGPGLLEGIYEKCTMRELQLRGLTAVSQRLVKIEYKGFEFEEPLRFDVLLENCLLLELLDIPVGLIINFHEMKLVDGIVRMILPGANR